MGFANWLRRHTIEHLVQNVPPDLYACELCGKTSCTQEEFASCEFRVHSEFLERKHLLDISRNPEIPRRESDDDVGSFDVVPLSPGILSVTTRSDPSKQDEIADSPARSGFRAVVRQDSGESQPESAIVERAEVEASAQTRRSARNT